MRINYVVLKLSLGAQTEEGTYEYIHQRPLNPIQRKKGNKSSNYVLD